ncbi:MAG: cation diffusion facilitator family transporter [Pirellulales bacterium]|nr:cation diffusion facilitator family transporter [Pirellulales bacterium]
MHVHQDHHHEHHQDRSSKNRRRLAIALLLAAVYMLAEIIGGIWTNSLALLADAGHMFSDVAALSLSFFAIWFAGRKAPPHHTYGYHRIEILAAVVNGAMLVAISILIFLEAFKRFSHPEEVQGPWMMAIAAGGLLVNLVSLWILQSGRHDNLNLRGAWLHVLMDAVGSVGAIVAGLLISLFGWYLADPIVSMLIGSLVIYSAWHLLSEAVSVLMESAPRGIDVDAVREAILDVPQVTSVHDLHIWTITSGFDSLSAHVVIEDGAKHQDALAALRDRLHQQFGIDHITIQLEPSDFVERSRCS